jgi:hypothetical protein
MESLVIDSTATVIAIIVLTIIIIIIIMIFIITIELWKQDLLLELCTIDRTGYILYFRMSVIVTEKPKSIAERFHHHERSSYVVMTERSCLLCSILHLFRGETLEVSQGLSFSRCRDLQLTRTCKPSDHQKAAAAIVLAAHRL